METLFRNMAFRLLALLAAFALALAQGSAQAQPARSFSQQELDQMLAPIALYPDALLSQILMAATYPMELIEAARWAREHPDLSGDAAVRAAEAEDWDPSVKSLLAFPQVLARMGENLQWTQALGDAFLEQEPQVMDTVQALRRKAQAAGNLRSDERVSVIENGPNLLVQPLEPQIVHVPYYDPLVVYGTWWWPAYPPMYLRPWPGYYARPAYAGGFYWAPAVGVSARFIYGGIDWHRRQVRVVQVNNIYYNKPAAAHPRPALPASRPGAWHRDPYQRPEPRAEVRIRPQWHAHPQPVRQEPRAHLEVPRSPQPRIEVRPAPVAARHDPVPMASARQGPVVHHPASHASAPRAEIRPPQASARQEPAARGHARPRMGP